MIASILKFLITLAVGIFAGIILCIELGIYEAYKSSRLESDLGVPFYTTQECRALFENGDIPTNPEEQTPEQKIFIENENNPEAISIRAQLQKKIKEREKNETK